MNDQIEDDDFSNGMEIPARILQNFRSFTIDPDARILNMFLISPFCLKILKENDHIHSFPVQFIPFLCSNYSNVFAYFDSDPSFSITNFKTLYLANLKVPTMKGYSACGGTDVSILGNVKSFPNCSISPDIFVSDDKVMIVKSVIGKECKIGKNVRIFNSVIYDFVVIEDNVMIKNSLIGSNSFIRSKSKIEQVVVCPGYSAEKVIDGKLMILHP